MPQPFLYTLQGTESGVRVSWLSDKPAPDNFTDSNFIEGLMGKFLAKNVGMNPTSGRAIGAHKKAHGFITQRTQGDLLFAFRSSPSEAVKGNDRAGYVIIRNNRVVGSLLTEDHTGYIL